MSMWLYSDNIIVVGQLCVCHHHHTCLFLLYDLYINMSEELPLPVPPSKGEEVPITESKPASISLEGTPETKTDKAPTDNYASSDSYSSSPRTDDEDDEDYDDGSVIMYKIEVQEAIKMDTHTGTYEFTPVIHNRIQVIDHAI